ncbi:MAG: alpha-L-fucosidase [Prevotellaceae bacterium]|jgi:alpha-L-fucosidase|nr:alpha-L-fucosidase [Prevotellaceae bacterium]
MMKNIFIPCIVCLFIVCHFSCSRVAQPEAVLPVPSERQLAWHELEQYAFIHFTTNTFTGREWGYGDESPSVFNPSSFDAEQWVKTISDAGLKALILTCKHHDGFCLWQSRYTEHSVKNSPFMEGKGDVVRAVSDACKKYGLKFGVYLSPWDRNHAGYATSEYVDYYRNQLRELLTGYGEISEIWFDGANGGDGFYGGAREIRKIDNKTYYDWKNTWSLVRELAPNVVMFSDAGPDVRWCGNERGYIGDPNWCTITNDTLRPGQPCIEKLLNHGTEGGTSWVPAEVDVSIRPGWFYHEAEDSLVRSPENLFKIYLQSVGRGAALLLNIPPDKRGLLHENDVRSLMEWKKMRDMAFSVNIAEHAEITANTWRGKSKIYAPSNVNDSNKETYWATDDGILGSLYINFGKVQKVNYVVIQEYIKLGQRVKSFSIDVWKNNDWQPAADLTTIGYKRIVPVEQVETDKIRISIKDVRGNCALISNVEIY